MSEKKYRHNNQKQATDEHTVVGLVGSIDVDTNVLGLRLVHDGELGTKLLQMETGDFFIELLGHGVHSNLVVLLPQGNLCQDLVGKRAGHDKGWVASGTSQIDQTAFSQQNDGVSIRENKLVHLGLDVDSLDSREVL